MASAVAPSHESKDFSPRLSLAVEVPASSSPFPSPSSSFLPPPVPGVHEFATLPSPRNSNGSVKKGNEAEGTEMTDRDKQITMNGIAGDDASRNPGKSQLLNLPPDSPAATPTTPTIPTPTPSSATAAGTKTPTPSSPLALDIPAADMGSSALSASRPAPPSPAPSRRSSAVINGTGGLSRHSSKSSTRPSLSGSTNRKSQLSSSFQYFTPSSSPAQSSASISLPQDPDLPKPKRRSLFLAKIRDFAFPSNDDRHRGKGPDVPRPNRYPKRMSTLSYASSSTSDDEDDGVSQANTWGGFKWGFGGGGWGFGNKGSRMPGEEDIDPLPSQVDFERNFTGGDEDDGQEAYADAEDEDEGEEAPLYPGLYKALYAFVPEGTAEMALEEEQIVRVIGRGGGVGWAVVMKPEGGHALVPESYLEPVKLDDEEE
ncbi:hypothetical protein NEOLEDRAFT_1136848 [Neolentinus lepideus HHB14362 ss-1]|uniref:SH3 domain-containing protein n=1 Tax=Neolentinus lepideus HHB14362 ss-1 TaxID=1314782 RepID=A0A165R2N4_9AGAM|nr:hypothetical protein NEOLEDRAFT_1136848 [Neolentinus lepideus HHB14362 ss-1]